MLCKDLPFLDLVDACSVLFLGWWAIVGKYFQFICHRVDNCAKLHGKFSCTAFELCDFVCTAFLTSIYVQSSYRIPWLSMRTQLKKFQFRGRRLSNWRGDYTTHSAFKGLHFILSPHLRTEVINNKILLKVHVLILSTVWSLLISLMVAHWAVLESPRVSGRKCNGELGSCLMNYIWKICSQIHL